MKKDQWDSCAEPDKMISCLESLSASRRKLRLFAVACCRRIWDSIPDERSRNAVVLAERYADGLCGEQELRAAASEAEAAREQYGVGTDQYEAHWAAWACANVASEFFYGGSALHCGVCATRMRRMAEFGESMPTFEFHLRLEEFEESERLVYSNLLRDIFDNPFQRPKVPLWPNPAPLWLTSPVADPEWLTSTVVALARGIYDDRAFDRMPILADALQDAGCDNADMLNHCRCNGPHVRGCWVVDLLLGKT
jgi:hypothetical protein